MFSSTTWLLKGKGGEGNTTRDRDLLFSNKKASKISQSDLLIAQSEIEFSLKKCHFD